MRLRRLRLGRLEVVAFVIGFCLLAYELVAARLLAPYIGSSIYVWTSVIGIIILALSLGYGFGGWLADKRVKVVDVAFLLLAAAGTASVTLLAYDAVLELVVALITDPRLQGLLASLVLFAPTSFILGSISPYLARLKLKSIKTTGRVVATLGAINSLGGISGTLITGFILFGYFSTNHILISLIISLVALSWLVASRSHRLERIVMSAGVILAALFGLNPPLSNGVLADINTASARYQIREVLKEQRQFRALVTGPGAWQSGSFTDGSNQLVFWYTRTIADIARLAPRHDTILVLGGGAFSLPRYFSEKYPESHITVVEIDPELPRIAKKYFYYEPAKNISVISEDARTFLNSNQKKYDIVVVDAYSDTSVPFALTTTEYAAALKKATHSSSQVIVNIIASTKGSCGELLDGINSSYKSSFAHAAYFPKYPDNADVRQNMIAAYSSQKFAWPETSKAFNPELPQSQSFSDDFTPTDRLYFECQQQNT